MNADSFEKSFKNQTSICWELLGAKGNQYSNPAITEDRLHNFRNAAALQNCGPMKALGGDVG